MLITESDGKGGKTQKAATPPQPTNTTADDLLYEDAKHHAVYTGQAHMS